MAVEFDGETYYGVRKCQRATGCEECHKDIKKGDWAMESYFHRTVHLECAEAHYNRWAEYNRKKAESGKRMNENRDKLVIK